MKLTDFAELMSCTDTVEVHQIDLWATEEKQKENTINKSSYVSNEVAIT